MLTPQQIGKLSYIQNELDALMKNLRASGLDASLELTGDELTLEVKQSIPLHPAPSKPTK